MGSRIAAVGVCLITSLAGTAWAETRIINGQVVPEGTWKEVVNLDANGAQCTGTIVGKRVMVTAAHCALTGDTVKFSIGGKQYNAKMTRSSLFPTKPHDVSAGLLDQDVEGVEPATVANKKPTVGMGIQLLGYGCTVPGGGGGASDGKLRIGDTVVASVTQMDYISQTDDAVQGAVLCWGDSGGPAMQTETLAGRAPKHLLVGINSRGDINKRSLSIRTDIDETVNFLKDFSHNNGDVKICGINDTCGGPPPPTKPTCVLVADPSETKVDQGTTLAMTITGTALVAKIKDQTVDPGHPVLPVTTPTEGHFTVTGFVSNDAGSNTCETSYTVKKKDPDPEKPTCTLVANPSTIKLNETTTVTLTVHGTATAATIDNVSVGPTGGSRTFKGDKLGTKTVNGAVVGGGETNTCRATFQVTDDPIIPPVGPNFSVVATHCGDNKFAADTGVTRACLGLIRNDGTAGDVKLTYVVIAIFSDGSREVLPILARKPRVPQGGDIQLKEDLSLYGNANYTENTGQLLLYMQPGVLTKLPSKGRGETPIALEGRTGKATKGKYFLVEQLRPVP